MTPERQSEQAAVNDEIVREIELRATQDKVWRAIADARQFGQWFRCEVEGDFVVGELNNCRGTYPGGEDNVWQKLIKAIEPERYFAYVWSPGDPGAVLFNEDAGHTLVEFTLAPSATGTHLTIRESGFASLPEAWGERSFERNTEGWDAQVGNITAYVES